MSNGADHDPTVATADGRRCNVRHALPRHFLYPSLLLLLTEEPRHGYRLVDALQSLGFGPVDRPSVYRALADLEGDGLLRSRPAAPTAGSTRYVYSVTAKGQEVLDTWMAVVGEQRDCLDLVLSRYVDASADAAPPRPRPGAPDDRLAALNGRARLNGGKPTH
jgi:DNA-binding PadR family transcriptional regulator